MPVTNEMCVFTIKAVLGKPNESRLWCRMAMPTWSADPAARANWMAIYGTLQAMQRQLPAALSCTPLEGSATYLLPAYMYEQMVNGVAP